MKKENCSNCGYLVRCRTPTATMVYTYCFLHKTSLLPVVAKREDTSSSTLLVSTLPKVNKFDVLKMLRTETCDAFYRARCISSRNVTSKDVLAGCTNNHIKTTLTMAPDKLAYFDSTAALGHNLTHKAIDPRWLTLT